MQLQLRDPYLTDGDYTVYVNGSNMRNGGRGFAVIQLDERGHVDLTFDEPEDFDRLIVAAAAAKQMLINARSPHAHHPAPDTGRCLDCGVLKAHHLEPVTADSEPKPAAHVCECGHDEAYHIGAVRGDDNPGPCTVCVTCDTYEAKS